MKSEKSYTARAVLITLILYVVLATVIMFSLNYKNPTFMETISLLVSLFSLVLVLESLEQAGLSIMRKKLLLQLFLVGKELLTSLSMSLVSLLLVVKICEFILGDTSLTKLLFNIIISSSFTVALISYYFYSKINIPNFLDHLSRKIMKTEEFSTTSLKESLNKKETENIIDLIVIFATVFLLANSTISTVDLNQKNSPVNFFDSLEFTALVIVLAVYVQAAYYKIPKKETENQYVNE